LSEARIRRVVEALGRDALADRHVVLKLGLMTERKRNALYQRA
jgi:hypothetical protein